MPSLTANYLEQLFLMQTDMNGLNRRATLPEPDGAGAAGASVTLTANAAADTWGAMVQIAATIGATAGYIVAVWVSNPSAAVEYTIEINRGNPDVAIGTVFYRDIAVAPQGAKKIDLEYPLRVPGGDRVRARVQSSQAVADTIDVKIVYYTNALGT